MKTSGKIIALVFVLFNSACEPEELPRPSSPSVSKKNTLLIVNTHLIPDIVSIEKDNIFLRWKGKATSNLAGDVNVSISHVANDFEDDESFRITDGYFNLWTDDQTCTLTGTYTGYGRRKYDQVIIEGEVRVQSGTGRLATQGGTLTLTIGRLHPDVADPHPSEIQIIGYLISPEVNLR